MTSSKHISFNILPNILRETRPWHWRLQIVHELHPVVNAAFKLTDPKDYQQLCMEWPHTSVSDVTRLAFTPDDRAGVADRQTVTTVGKYLTRHFPALPDHSVRDLVAKYATASTFSVSSAIEDIVAAAQDGPPSCMQWTESEVDYAGHHPYEAYDPKYGWAIAVRRDGNSINGRALVMEREGRKYFVRTFQRPRSASQRYSEVDEQLNQWLTAQGYEHLGGWANEKLAYLESSDRNYDFVAPYIDGHTQNVDEDYQDGHRCLCITDDGVFKCTDTNGGYTEIGGCTCEDCGRRVSEDETRGVGYHNDRSVGECCIDEYTLAVGRRGEEYWVPNNEAVECDGEYYDSQYTSDNNIVCLHDGEYASIDDAICIESQGEWYRTDDDAIVEDHNDEWQMRDDCVELENGDWALSDDAWCCEASGEYYLSDDVDPVTIHGMTFHPDASAEDIAEAIKDKTGQENLFVGAVQAEVAVDSVTGESVHLMRGLSGMTRLVPESRVAFFKLANWTLVDTPIVTAYPHANSVYETL